MNTPIPWPHRGLDEGKAFHGIVAVVSGRLDYRLGNDDAAGEMQDAADGMVGKNATHQILIADIAFDQHISTDGTAER